ncbi:hypothetical protein [Micromonospora globbae]|uniref:hypothetical protein n=1 Tax=Micromonospora globbae TaxID=1894969 RepID=UPI003870CCA7|nr:hypothetical protein OH732_27995 [Micromonospora globbae]
MPADEAQLWQLLHSLDDPNHLEFPANYNHQRARARFNQLVERLNRDFGCQCDVDREVQDASFHGRIDVPAAATATGERLVIVISNFGDLAVLAVENPGVWDDEEAAQVLHPDDTTRIRRALDDLGYTLIPEGPLWKRYDGPGDTLAPDDTWWTRYFDYL